MGETVLVPVEAAGNPRDLGRAFGEFAAERVRRVVLPTPYWARTVAHAGSERVRAMEAATRATLPELAEEVEGLAEGLSLPFAEVFAWICRGDLRADLPEGCTTVMVPGTERVIGHNEDGDPGEDRDCGLVLARPDGAPAFAAFVYPGSVPGSAFGVNDEGLVVTVNNVRARHAAAGVPRMLVGRAMLGCRGLDQAVRLIESLPRAGAFHFAMAQAGDHRLLSVEFDSGLVSVREVTSPTAHANHFVHPGMADLPQIVTRSSADRQLRADALLERPPLAVLQDAGGPGLPIFRRDPADPDEENTVVSAVARLGAQKVELAIHNPGAAEPGVLVTVENGTIRVDTGLG